MACSGRETVPLPRSGFPRPFVAVIARHATIPSAPLRSASSRWRPPLAKDFENLTENAVAFSRLASIRLMLRRLAGAAGQGRFYGDSVLI